MISRFSGNHISLLFDNSMIPDFQSEHMSKIIYLPHTQINCLIKHLSLLDGLGSFLEAMGSLLDLLESLFESPGVPFGPPGVHFGDPGLSLGGLGRGLGGRGVRSFAAQI